ncbi:MAG: cupin domain-containing protein [Bacteroidetes bacterium]|nr:MAG: cupin domain-containing protein [Bacteroidota bacterium]
MAQPPKIIPANGMGDGAETRFLVTAVDSSNIFEWFETTLPFGSGPAYHSHQRTDEVLRVLAGEVKFKLGGIWYDLSAGDTCFIPRSTPHAFTNIYPDTTAQLLGVVIPAGLETFLRVLETALAHGPPDEIILAELAVRFDQAILGPSLAVELGLSVDGKTVTL